MSVAPADVQADAALRESLSREMVTPEGVDLRVVLASAGQRAGAFLLDAAMIVGLLVAVTIACVLLGFSAGGQGFKVMGVIWLFGFFALRNFWFLGFELGPRAATPGKRLMKLRVASRDGGRLSADAAFARNAMREIEVFLPLTFLAMNSARGVDGWIALLGLVWSGGLLLFPLFNRDRLRVGDLVAGTWVVRTPRAPLLGDLAVTRPAQPARYAFTTAQLDAYGIKELEVLEGVVRRNNRADTRAVADRIRDRIGWAERPGDSDGEFLDAYYAALRNRLESRLLFGRRRRDKHDRG